MLKNKNISKCCESCWVFSLVCSDIEFLERVEGESVVLRCAFDLKQARPIGVSLWRTKPTRSRVLFKLSGLGFTSADQHRISVSGDPKDCSVNITISQLRSSDTNLYFCEFDIANQSSADETQPGKMKFLLVVGKSTGKCFFLSHRITHLLLTGSQIF